MTAVAGMCWVDTHILASWGFLMLIVAAGRLKRVTSSCKPITFNYFAQIFYCCCGCCRHRLNLFDFCFFFCFFLHPCWTAFALPLFTLSGSMFVYICASRTILSHLVNPISNVFDCVYNWKWNNMSRTTIS